MRSCRRRSASTSAGAPSSPSHPQFHDRFARRAVGAAPAVGLVVLAVVADEVVEREAVVAGEEVDALERRVDEVGAALDALHHRRHETRLGAQEAAPDLAERVVPVPPPGARPLPVRGGGRRRRPTARRSSTTSRSAAHAVRSVDERAVVGEDGGEVEAEAVDAEVGEAVERPAHEVLGDRRRDVEVVAAARSSRCTSRRRAAGRTRRRRGPRWLYVGPVAASTSVVWLNTTSSQTSMSRAWAAATRSASSAAASSAARVLAVDGAEGQRHVPPVAALLRVVLVHRQQLDDGDAERGPGAAARRRARRTCRARRRPSPG